MSKPSKFQEIVDKAKLENRRDIDNSESYVAFREEYTLYEGRFGPNPNYIVHEEAKPDNYTTWIRYCEVMKIAKKYLSGEISKKKYEKLLKESEYFYHPYLRPKPEEQMMLFLIRLKKKALGR